MAYGRGIRAGNAFVTLGLVDKDFVNGLKRATATLKTSLRSMQQMGAQMAAIGGTGLAGFFGTGKLAADLNEAVNKSNEIFGNASKAVADFAKTSANAFGISKTAATEYSATLGAILKSAGYAGDELASMSIDLVKLAADIASFNNISIDEALEKLRAGLVGSSEPLRTVGVLLSENAVKAEAYATGIAKAGAELTDQQKVQARYALIIKQTADAQGDFARTAKSFSNAMRRVQALLVDLGTEIGQTIVPAMEKLTNIMADTVRWATDFIKANPMLVKGVFTLTIAVTALGVALMTAGTAGLAFMGVIGGIATAIGILMSPITLIVGAIALWVTAFYGAAAAVVYWWHESSKAAQALTASIARELTKIQFIFSATFQGIMKSIRHGEWQLAGKIAVAGLKAAFLTGMESIARYWKIWLVMLGKSFDQFINNIVLKVAFTILKVKSLIGKSLKLFTAASIGDLPAQMQIQKEINTLLTKTAPQMANDFFAGIGESAGDARKELARLIKEAAKLGRKPVKQIGGEPAWPERRGIAFPAFAGVPAAAPAGLENMQQMRGGGTRGTFTGMAASQLGGGGAMAPVKSLAKLVQQGQQAEKDRQDVVNLMKRAAQQAQNQQGVVILE